MSGTVITRRPLIVAGIHCGYAPDYGPGLGHWQDLDDGGYRRARKRLLRTLEDIEDGDVPASRRAVICRQLAETERIIDVRAALAEAYGACDVGVGSDDCTDFAFDPETGTRERLTDRGPTYGLAADWDRERHCRGESTVLSWDEGRAG